MPYSIPTTSRCPLRFCLHTLSPHVPCSRRPQVKLSGNHLKGSRPVLSFDAAFDDQPHYQLVKEMLTQVRRRWRGVAARVVCLCWRPGRARNVAHKRRRLRGRRLLMTCLPKHMP